MLSLANDTSSTRPLYWSPVSSVPELLLLKSTFALSVSTSVFVVTGVVIVVEILFNAFSTSAVLNPFTMFFPTFLPASYADFPLSLTLCSMLKNSSTTFSWIIPGECIPIAESIPSTIFLPICFAFSTNCEPADSILEPMFRNSWYTF